MSHVKRQTLIDVFLRTNSQLNLSAIRDEEGVLVKHIYDSLEAEKVLQPLARQTWADVGTGGGFPLLPLAIQFPESFFVGIDSVHKKLRAIQDMVQEIGLKNVQTVWTRIEEHRTQYDVVTARAVAYSDKLIPWVRHLVKKQGYLLLYKEDKKEEKEVLFSLLDSYRLRLCKEHYYSLFEGDIRRVLYLLQAY